MKRHIPGCNGSVGVGRILILLFDAYLEVWVIFLIQEKNLPHFTAPGVINGCEHFIKESHLIIPNSFYNL